MKLYLERNKICHYLLIAIMIMFQGAVYFKMNENLYLMIAFGLCIVCSVMGKSKEIDLHSVPRYYVYVISSLISLLFSSIFNNGSLSIMSIGNVLVRLVLAYTVVMFDSELFVHRYIKLVYVLSLISLIGFFFQSMFPNVLSALLPRVSYSGMYGCPLFMWDTRLHADRNVGIFAEPGLYAIVLLVAIYFMLYKSDMCGNSQKAKQRYFVVFVLTLITAKSTTGYIAFIVIFMAYFLKQKKDDLSKVSYWGLFAITLFVCFDLFRGSNSILQKYLLDKIFNSAGTLDLSVSTGASRIGSMYADISMMLKYPMGAGFSIYEQEWKSHLTMFIWDQSSCVGLTKSLATYGIPCVAIFLVMLLTMHRKQSNGLVESFACILVFVLMTLSQPTIFFPVLICMFLIPKSNIYAWEDEYVRYFYGE